LDSYIIESNKKKSRIPARLDFVQSGTGLILGLFMWVHMLLVGSIILGKGSFNFVAKNMELAFLSDTGHGFPIAVFFLPCSPFSHFLSFMHCWGSGNSPFPGNSTELSETRCR